MVKKNEAPVFECAVGGKPVMLMSRGLQPLLPMAQSYASAATSKYIYLECSFEDLDAPPSEPLLTGAAPSIVSHPHFDIEILSDMALDFHEKRILRLKLYPKTEGTI